MSKVNQLILDCAAKVLCINETTDAQIDFEISGHVHAVECGGWTHGYSNGNKVMHDGVECHERDFLPLSDLPWIDISQDEAAGQLRALLESLNALEKELLTKEEN